jgi:hypothetical protein
MFDDEFDDDFDEDDLSGDEDEDTDSHRNFPVFKKAMQIGELTRIITDTFDPQKDIFNLREQMMLNAYTLGAKIAGAEGGDLFSIRFDNATLIKLAARELLAETSLCKEEKLCDKDYLDMLRKEIEEFRKLFIEWVRSFDKTNDIKDDWDILDL